MSIHQILKHFISVKGEGQILDHDAIVKLLSNGNLFPKDHPILFFL